MFILISFKPSGIETNRSIQPFGYFAKILFKTSIVKLFKSRVEVIIFYNNYIIRPLAYNISIKCI